MLRFSQRRLASELAITILVVFVAVSITDIDDYAALPQGVLSSASDSSTPANGSPEMSPPPADSGSDPEHACSCLLCVMTLSSPFGPRVLPPSAGKLSKPMAAGLALSSHMTEVFHPPSA